jgi:hypothetical protein
LLFGARVRALMRCSLEFESQTTNHKPLATNTIALMPYMTSKNLFLCSYLHTLLTVIFDII